MSGPVTRPWGFHDEREVIVRDVVLLNETEKALLVRLAKIDNRDGDGEWFPRAHARMYPNGARQDLIVAAWLARERRLVERLDQAHTLSPTLPILARAADGAYVEVGPELPLLEEVELWMLQTALDPLSEEIAWILNRQRIEEAKNVIAASVEEAHKANVARAQALADLKDAQATNARAVEELDRLRAHLAEARSALARAANRATPPPRLVTAPTSANIDVFTAPPAPPAAPPRRPSAVSAAVASGARAVTAETAAPPAEEPADASEKRFSLLEIDEDRPPRPGRDG